VDLVDRHSPSGDGRFLFEAQMANPGTMTIADTPVGTMTVSDAPGAAMIVTDAA
jgi:hypothetical protein